MGVEPVVGDMVGSFVVGGELGGRTLVGRPVEVAVEVAVDVAVEAARPASELVQPDSATLAAKAAEATTRRLIPLIVPVAG
ncbi:hypothetical protein [Humibacillus sp. DSM 29435]|uniref:hypothetical protein n=1 Tax=Humibacillus sp. DSM 29435 TaxID=1869167 RepID=UPI00111321DF|nr:hypothetical protein [Humibacillus sp. DSM 29435]